MFGCDFSPVLGLFFEDCGETNGHGPHGATFGFNQLLILYASDQN
jgi:hypothetical protein